MSNRIKMSKFFVGVWTWILIAVFVVMLSIVLAEMAGARVLPQAPGPRFDSGQVLVPDEPTERWCNYFSYAEGIDEEGVLVGPVAALDCVSDIASDGRVSLVSYKFLITEDMAEEFLSVFGEEQDEGFIVQ